MRDTERDYDYAYHLQSQAARLQGRRDLAAEEYDRMVELIREARAAGMTLRDVASYTGLSRQRIHQIDGGQ